MHTKTAAAYALADKLAELTEEDRAAVFAGFGYVPRPKRAAKPKAAPRPRKLTGPRLTDGQFASVTARWAEAVNAPKLWRAELEARAARDCSRGSGAGVRAAWGITHTVGGEEL